MSRPGSVTTYFPPGYKEEVFLAWYQAGKPTASMLYDIIEPDRFSGAKPSVPTLSKWITYEFRDRAEELDNQVTRTIVEKAVAEKVEMLKRHAEVGRKMQEMAIEYLEEHKEYLSSNSAVRLLVEGIRIERQSVGLPEAIEDLASVSDDSLLDRIRELIASSPVTIEQIPQLDDDLLEDEEQIL